MEASLDPNEWEVVQSPNQQQSSNSLDPNEWEVVSDQPKKQERSMLEQAGRLAGQFGIGMAENAALPYEIAVAPLAIPGGQEAMGDLFTREVLSDVYPTEEEGKQIGGRELKEPINIGIRGLLEKATGMDLHPEGALEKGASWIGFIKNPNNLKELAKNGVNPKDLVKALSPTKTQTLRGLGAGVALEMAEDGQFGPIGTLAAAVVGDAAGGGLGAFGKAVTQPKNSVAKLFSKFTPSEKKALQQDIIKDFREAGIQADIGTITNNELVKMMQSKLAQSGLTGGELVQFRESMMTEIKGQYKKLAEELGNHRFDTLHEAGEVSKEYITKIRDAEKQRIGKMYDAAREQVEVAGKKAAVNPVNLATKINELENKLAPGSLKSTEQKAVVDVLEKLKKDIYESPGKLKLASVEDLINNKTALNDIINYEVQGGQKQLLKSLVHDLDKEIINYGKQDVEFLRNYVKANKEFGAHAKTFRNNNINRILMSDDPMVVMNKMNSVQGMRDIGNALNKTAEGKQLFKDLQRTKLDQMIGNKMVDNTSQQLKMGTFANLLKNPKDAQLAREILGKEAFERLQRLQKSTGELEKTARKFFNASHSGVHVTDMAIVSSAISSLGAMIAGNPWPFLASAAGFQGARYMTKLIADPSFLKMVEEAVLASEKNNTSKLMQIGERLIQPIKAAIVQSNQVSQ